MKVGQCLAPIPVLCTGLLLITFALRVIKLIRSFARLWADRKVRKLYRDWIPPLDRALNRFLARSQRVGPGSPSSDLTGHWVAADILCMYVGFLLVLAALIATVGVSELPRIAQISPLAEPTAATFICVLWVMADFFYREALQLRSEVMGSPMLAN
jgi:hypothetical protein